MRHSLLIVLCSCVFACQDAAPPAGDQPAVNLREAPLPPGSAREGMAFEFEEVVPGIFHVRGTGNLSVGSHGAVIVNEDDVLLVESHISPAAARAVVDEIEVPTDKPVRYVVNTHYHFDHAHGNQIYPPGVHVIGHEVTREMLENGSSLGRSYELFVGSLSESDRGAGRRGAAHGHRVRPSRAREPARLSGELPRGSGRAGPDGTKHGRCRSG